MIIIQHILGPKILIIIDVIRILGELLDITCSIMSSICHKVAIFSFFQIIEKNIVEIGSHWVIMIDITSKSTSIICITCDSSKVLILNFAGRS